MNVKELETHWSALQPIFSIHTEEDYDRAVAYLNELIDEVNTDETHPLYELLDILGTILHNYEETHYRYRLPATNIHKAIDLLTEANISNFESTRTQNTLSRVSTIAIVLSFVALVIGLVIGFVGSAFFTDTTADANSSTNFVSIIVAITFLLSLFAAALSALISSISTLPDMLRFIKNPFSYTSELAKKSLKLELEMLKEFYNIEREDLIIAYTTVLSEVEETKRRINLIIGMQERIGFLPSIISILAIILNALQSSDPSISPLILYIIAFVVISLQFLALWIQASFSDYQPRLALLEKAIEWKKESEESS